MSALGRIRFLGMRCAASAIITLAATIAWMAAGASAVAQSVPWIFAAYLLAVCILLRWRSAAVLVGAGAAFALAFRWINEAKIALTQAPLTALDMRIAFGNPQGLWYALGWPEWTLYIALAAIAMIVVTCAWIVGRDARRHLRWMPPRLLGATAFALAWALSGASYFTASLPGLLAPGAASQSESWRPATLAEYSRSVGPMAFVVFSLSLENHNTGAYFDPSLPDEPVSSATLAEASRRYVQPAPAGGRLPPNIVVVFAESTFDPNRAFRLKRRLELPLFTRQPDTVMAAGLRVNAVGGNSWITEFETITGMDSRLFGFAGYYTHATLSPFIQRSFASYLSERGYDTAAYYPWEGEFYNARRAYGSYGFSRFRDARELGLRTSEPRPDDQQVAEAALREMESTQRAPLFSYVVLTENHAPHQCEHFAASSEFVTELAGTRDFQINCALNEYLRRLESTTRAVDRIADFLKMEQGRTGRPYVLAVFGDHQPHTFTSTYAPPYSKFDYSRYRTAASDHETFVHIRSSAANPIRCCDGPAPPATLIPTLLSAFVATDVSELYLPENFYLYQACGSNLLDRKEAPGERDGIAGAAAGLLRTSAEDQASVPTGNETCREAFPKALPAYHEEHVFR